MSGPGNRLKITRMTPSGEMQAMLLLSWMGCTWETWNGLNGRKGQ